MQHVDGGDRLGDLLVNGKAAKLAQRGDGGEVVRRRAHADTSIATMISVSDSTPVR
jgi:hypothetical protein